MTKAKTFLAGILTAMAVTFVSLSTGQAADTGFQLLQPAQPTQSGDKIEVVEIFWYGCPHCYSLEPYLDNWLENKPEDVEFRRIPGVLGRDWMAHARAFYTAEQLGILEKIHRPLFDAIHKDRKNIVSGKQLRNFFADYGVDKDEFTRIFDSEEVTGKIKEAFIAAQNYKITGVPTIIVNGKYRTSASQAGGNKQLIEIINKLIEMERNQSG